MASTDQRVCYTRNGTQITDRAYRPCSNDPTRDAPCCGTAHQAVGHTQVADDVCESNGLCQNFEPFNGNNKGAKLWWRQGCTDPTWQSDNCLKNVCNFGIWQNDNAPVQGCGDNKWCCGEKSCCSISSSVFTLAATVGPTASASAASAVATGSNSAGVSSRSLGPSPAPTSDNLSTTPAASGSSSGLSTAAQAGIGVAAAVVVLLLGVIAWLVWRLKKRREAEKMDVANVPMSGQEEKHQSTVYAYQDAPPPVEMYAESTPVELGGPHHTELPAWNDGHAQNAPQER